MKSKERTSNVHCLECSHSIYNNICLYVNDSAIIRNLKFESDLVSKKKVGSTIYRIGVG